MNEKLYESARMMNPNKYNQGRAMLKQLSIPPPNWLSKTVYSLLKKHGYSWNPASKVWER